MNITRQTSEQILQAVDELLAEILALRKDLHRNPELSWREQRTTQRITAFLEAHKLPGMQHPLKTGAVLDLNGRDSSAPRLLLRADIDALPLQDEKDVPHRSLQDGVCHAGHDAHTAIVAGTAVVLKNRFPGHGNYRFVFQPAEEPIPSGAPEMIAAGALDGVSHALGLHMEPRLPLGTIGLTPGWINMQSVRLDLILRGPGGHSARPHEAPDLVWLAAGIVRDSYEMVYRRMNLLDSPVILTFTEIHAARGYNIIPGELRLTGTVRVGNPEKRDLFLEMFQALLQRVEAEAGIEIEFHFQAGAPAIYNHPELIARLTRHLQENFSLPVRIEREFRTPGGDDFSHYVNRVPGAMIRIGVGSGPETPGLHDGRFDVPDEALRYGVAFFVTVLLAFAGEDFSPEDLLA